MTSGTFRFMGSAVDKPITVGHVEVPDLWVDIPTDSSLTVQEVITLSGMRPRDGTPVQCYLTSGEIFAGVEVAPGQRLVVGTRPPMASTRHVQINPKMHYMTVRWDRAVGGSRVGSGILEDGCTLWVPGVRRGSDIRAVEVSRHENSNGKAHSQGYRVRRDSVPYFRGDLARVFSSGEGKFRLFDPETGELTVPVTVISSSYKDARGRERDSGRRLLWTVRVLNFDSDRRRVLVEVDALHTW